MYNCRYCHNAYSTRFNLNRHEKNCAQPKTESPQAKRQKTVISQLVEPKSRWKEAYSFVDEDTGSKELAGLLDGRGVVRSIFNEYTSLTNVSESYQFSVTGTDNMFTDLRNCFIKVEISVVREDGSPLTDEDEKKIRPTNDLIDSLFSTVDISFASGHRRMQTGTEQLRPQMAMLNKLLNYNKDYLDEVCFPFNLFQKDYKQFVHYFAIYDQKITKSNRITLYLRLFEGFFAMNQLLLPRVGMDVTLKRNPAEFCLIREAPENGRMLDDKYKLIIHECILKAKRVQLVDSLRDEIEQKLNEGAIPRYPYTRMDTHLCKIATGSVRHRIHVMGMGACDLPRKRYLVICDAESVSGTSWENNPMVFPAALHKVNHVQFYVDYQPVLAKPLQPDFENGKYLDSFHSLIQTSNTFEDGQMKMGISYKEFGDSYGVFGIQDLPYYGSLEAEIKFAEPTNRELCSVFVALKDMSIDMDFVVNL